MNIYKQYTLKNCFIQWIMLAADLWQRHGFGIVQQSAPYLDFSPNLYFVTPGVNAVVPRHSSSTICKAWRYQLSNLIACWARKFCCVQQCQWCYDWLDCSIFHLQHNISQNYQVYAVVQPQSYISKHDLNMLVNHKNFFCSIPFQWTVFYYSSLSASTKPSI